MSGLTPNARRFSAELSRDPRPQGAPHYRAEQATVTAVTAGAAADGNDLVTVNYRDADQQVAYLSSYTPLVGHTVGLLVGSDGSLLILGRIIGTP